MFGFAGGLGGGGLGGCGWGGLAELDAGERSGRESDVPSSGG